MGLLAICLIGLFLIYHICGRILAYLKKKLVWILGVGLLIILVMAMSSGSKTQGKRIHPYQNTKLKTGIRTDIKKPIFRAMPS